MGEDLRDVPKKPLPPRVLERKAQTIHTKLAEVEAAIHGNALTPARVSQVLRELQRDDDEDDEDDLLPPTPSPAEPSKHFAAAYERGLYEGRRELAALRDKLVPLHDENARLKIENSDLRRQIDRLTSRGTRTPCR